MWQCHTVYLRRIIKREKDQRQRDDEFEATASHSKEQMLAHLNATMTMISEKLDHITPKMLVEDFLVQGFKENGTSILVHITEHFSYHVGQITYLTKFLNNVDTAYYAGLDLNAKNT